MNDVEAVDVHSAKANNDKDEFIKLHSLQGHCGFQDDGEESLEFRVLNCDLPF